MHLQQVCWWFPSCILQLSYGKGEVPHRGLGNLERCTCMKLIIQQGQVQGPVSWLGHSKVQLQWRTDEKQPWEEGLQRFSLMKNSIWVLAAQKASHILSCITRNMTRRLTGGDSPPLLWSSEIPPVILCSEHGTVRPSAR